VGLPGSGKTRYLAQLGVNSISSDALRLQLTDDENDQTIHAPIFATMRWLARQRMELGRPVTYIDATNLTRKDRRQFIDLARECGGVAEALFFDIPTEVCAARNAARARVVPKDVLLMMAAKLEPPEVDEGFERVEVVRPG
jgi:predicted kinase